MNTVQRLSAFGAVLAGIFAIGIGAGARARSGSVCQGDHGAGTDGRRRRLRPRRLPVRASHHLDSPSTAAPSTS